MKTKNYYLREIVKNTGSKTFNMKNEIFYLKQIASNFGASVTGNSKNRNYYLELIAENTKDYKAHDDYVALICNTEIVQKDDIITCMARVMVDGESVSGQEVKFYVEE